MCSRSQLTAAAGALRNAAAPGQIPQLQQQGDSCCRVRKLVVPHLPTPGKKKETTSSQLSK